MWTASPWVEQHLDAVSFALQVFPIDTPVDPAAHLLAAGRLAEDLGFDAFFVGDHPAWALDPWLHLAALAVTTRRIGLGVNVCCALYRHPVLTARLAAVLDNLSNGRLFLGLGNGWDANEFANLGLPFLPARERQVALAEAIESIGALQASSPTTFPKASSSATRAHGATTSSTPRPIERSPAFAR
jgi:alkanesulfonate monooxygenase SsuD/methylene tetrahydromethanopterin reductase-like flavin-dependent oxidoreductase (luciferase family)